MTSIAGSRIAAFVTGLAARFGAPRRAGRDFEETVAQRLLQGAAFVRRWRYGNRPSSPAFAPPLDAMPSTMAAPLSSN
jgi:hypothetical protein